MDRCGTGPRSFGATFWNPGVKTEKTAKKRRKNEQKWARYGLTKRVWVADLFVMDRYPASPLTKLVLLLISGWRTRTRLLRAPAPMPVRVGSPLSRNAPPSSQAAPRLRRLRPRTSEHATMKRYTDLHPALKSLQHYTKAQHSLSAAGIRVILLNQQRLTARRSSSGL